jgi:outer membrane protein OmpA-like peptidoglycan-associated protein
MLRPGTVTLLLLLMLRSAAQEHYEVAPVDLSPPGVDYAPVLLDSSVVICSLRDQGTIVVRDAVSDDPLSDLYRFEWNAGRPSNPALLSPELASEVNDGPASFSLDGTTICFTRNQRASTRKRRGEEDRLGLFFAALIDGRWSKPAPFDYNSRVFSIMHPAFSPDGTHLYFASDMPGGLGGTDLYRSDLVDGQWDIPVNLGGSVNSDANELFPFIASDGTLYFSSDRGDGPGKLDIHQCRALGMKWNKAEVLPEPLNSAGNDMGYTSFRTDRSGFLSSDRSGSDRIYSFRRMPKLFAECGEQEDNNYCYSFNEPGEFSKLVEDLPLQYSWLMGDGMRINGSTAEHCYKGPGTYRVELEIIDSASGEVFFNAASYELRIDDIQQPYITSADTVRSGRATRLDALHTYLPGHTREEFHWDLGDGNFAEGRSIDHMWSVPGEHVVRLAVVGINENSRQVYTRCVTKTLTVIRRFDDSADQPVLTRYQDASGNVHAFNFQALPFDQFNIAARENEDVRFSVKILESTVRLDLNDARFAEVRKFYPVLERYDPEKGIYVYSVGQAKDLREMYEVFKKMLELEFMDAEVAVIHPDKVIDLSALELLTAQELNNSVVRESTVRFDNGKDTFGEDFRPRLDKLVDLLAAHPQVRMIIEAHTDALGSNAANLALSQRRAQRIADYLGQRTDMARLVPIGFGEEHPIADNGSATGRAQNRRVEFRLVLREDQAYAPKPR